MTRSRSFSESNQIARFGMLSGMCQRMCYYASQMQQRTNYLKDVICHKTEHMKSFSSNKDEAMKDVKNAVPNCNINLGKIQQELQ